MNFSHSDFAPVTLLRCLVSVWAVFMIYPVSQYLLGNTGRTELRGSCVGVLTAEKQCQSHIQTTGERLRSQARLIDILTYCTFPGRGLPCGNTLLPYSSPPPGFDPLNVKQIVAEDEQRLIWPVWLRGDSRRVGVYVKVSVDVYEWVYGPEALT